jgi:DNA-binding IclR family transcriptional regulator
MARAYEGSNEMSSKSGEPPVKVLRKAGELLNELAETDELTPAELSQRLGEPRSTIYRLLESLEQLGFVDPGTGGSYRLGMQLFRLGNAAARRFTDIRGAAGPAIERLHAETGETVFLTIRRGFEAVCLERLDGQFVGVMILPVGGSVPLHGGANARALLAFEPPEFWEEYLDHAPLRRFTAKTVTSRKEFIKELERIRRDGYSISDEDVIDHIASVGAPLFDYGGRVRGAISLSGPRPAILGTNRGRSIRLVKEAAGAASRSLGREDSPPGESNRPDERAARAR